MYCQKLKLYVCFIDINCLTFTTVFMPGVDKQWFLRFSCAVF